MTTEHIFNDMDYNYNSYTIILRLFYIFFNLMRHDLHKTNLLNFIIIFAAIEWVIWRYIIDVQLIRYILNNKPCAQLEKH